MNKRDKELIEKVVKYIGKIQAYSAGMEYGDFIGDTKTSDACAFAVIQISELSWRISEEIRTKHPRIPWLDIKGMRNLIVHDYEKVDLSVFWDTIGDQLPELKSDLETILAENK